MADFTAKDVQALRQATGAGMMDAKRALTDNDGDAEAAAKWLREKGLAKAGERASRVSEQGAVAVAIADGGSGAALVELKSETDYVAKSPDFRSLVEDLARAVAAEGEDAVTSRQDEIDSLKIKLKENIGLGRVVRFEPPEGAVIDTYLHLQSDRGVNGVLVEVVGGDRELAHDIALHVGFARPEYLSRDDVPPERVAEERTVLENISRNRGQTRAGPAQDRGGPAQRLVQGAGPARAAVRQGQQADDRPTARTGPGHPVRPGGDRAPVGDTPTAGTMEAGRPQAVG